MSKPLTAQRLRKTNIYAGILHFVQMAAVLALSSDFSLPVTATYMSGPPGSTYAPPVTLFETPIGLLQEKYETPGNGGYLPYIFGCITGIVPWLALMFYVFGIGGAGETKAPAFVYVIVLTIFLFFNSFALVQLLQYKKVGKYSDYLHGEAAYIALSLIAKSAVAWQIFANTLIP